MIIFRIKCGIPHSKVVYLFGKPGESWKKDAKAGGDRSLHGQYGRGRFKALSLGSSVKWLTIYEEHGEFYEYSISADANKINNFSVSEPKLSHCKESGTIVEISNLSNDKGELLSENSIIDLTKEFSLLLTEYSSKKIIFNTILVSPVAVTGQSTPLYENDQSVHGRKIRTGKSVAVLGSLI